MSIMDALRREEAWQEFYQYKKKARLSPRDEKALFLFIEQKGYLPLANRLAVGEYCFGLPRKLLINKMDGGKKRAVYSFAQSETMILKLLSYLLYRYDGYFTDRLYSFRRNKGAHQAVQELTAVPFLEKMYCYKADVADYFNSIDVERLLPMLADIMDEEEGLMTFFRALLTEERVVWEDRIIRERKGVMAGIPVAPFLANVYLHGLDKVFLARKVSYARYSDDIICFAATYDEILQHKAYMQSWLADYGLALNSRKETLSLPGEAWEFLGIRYLNGQIDLSQGTMAKMKGKIRRKARSMRRWTVRKQVDEQKAIRAFIKSMNRKFFIGKDSNDLTWSRWFFPLLTVDGSLKELDGYMQQYIRFIATGRHSKANYRLRYAAIKDLGYRSLVHEYYLYRKQGSLGNDS